MLQLFNVRHVFCGACTEQEAPFLKPQAWSGCACVRTIASGRSRSNLPSQSRPQSIITFAPRYETSSELCMRCCRVRASISPRVPRNVSFIVKIMIENLGLRYLGEHCESNQADDCGPLRRRIFHCEERKSFPTDQTCCLGPARRRRESQALQGCKAFPGGSREWNWRETNTEHVPG